MRKLWAILIQPGTLRASTRGSEEKIIHAPFPPLLLCGKFCSSSFLVAYIQEKYTCSGSNTHSIHTDTHSECAKWCFHDLFIAVSSNVVSGFYIIYYICCNILAVMRLSLWMVYQLLCLEGLPRGVEYMFATYSAFLSLTQVQLDSGLLIAEVRSSEAALHHFASGTNSSYITWRCVWAPCPVGKQMMIQD